MNFSDFQDELDRWADDGGAVNDFHYAVAEHAPDKPADITKEMPIDLLVMLFIEHRGISKLWREVIAHCGANVNVLAVPAPPWRMDMYNMGVCALRDDDGREVSRIFGYGGGISTVYTQEMLAGMMAHELGHLVNGDVDNNVYTRDSEWAADAFAAKHGYGLDLAEALKVADIAMRGCGECESCKANKKAEAEDEHPPILDRIAMLTKAAHKTAQA